MSDEDQLREARLRREVDSLDSVGQALFESFRSLGMDDESALVATKGRTPEDYQERYGLSESASRVLARDPADQRHGLSESAARVLAHNPSDFNRLADAFARLGLSESAAEHAATGRHSTPAGARLAESRAASPAGGRGRGRSRPEAEWVAIRNAAREVGAIGRGDDIFANEAARPFIRAVDQAQDRGQSLGEAINAAKAAQRDTVSEAGGPSRDGQRQTGTSMSIREVRNR